MEQAPTVYQTWQARRASLAQAIAARPAPSSAGPRQGPDYLGSGAHVLDYLLKKYADDPVAHEAVKYPLKYPTKYPLPRRQKVRGFPAHAIWERLRSIKRFESITSFSRGGLNGSTLGRVTQRSLPDGTLIFEEYGRWHGAGPAQFITLKGFNEYWWRPVPTGVSLFHARQGQPVHLADFVSLADPERPVRQDYSALRSARPHQCGEDSYLASLFFLEDGALELCWEIEGPTQQGVISVRYTG